MEAYYGLAVAFFLVGVLVITSVLVLDYVLLRTRHVPGTDITGGHKEFAFRANRAVGNLNESIAAFVLLALAAVWVNASPTWVNAMALVYAISRWLYAFAYYFNWKRARSTLFGFAIAALVILAAVVGLALLQRL